MLLDGMKNRVIRAMQATSIPPSELDIWLWHLNRLPDRERREKLQQLGRWASETLMKREYPNPFNSRGYTRLETSLPISAEPPPDARKLFQRFRTAISRWRAAGYPIVPFITLYSRWKICRQCPFWSGWRCKHPGCGCTGVKLGLATERCPI